MQRVAVARGETLQRHCHVPHPLRLGRWAPLPPLLRPMLVEQAVDDGGEIRREGAAALEFRDDLVVALDQLELDVADEVLGIGVAHVHAAAVERGDPLDRRNVREETLFRAHANCLELMRGSLAGETEGELRTFDYDLSYAHSSRPGVGDDGRYGVT